MIRVRFAPATAVLTLAVSLAVSFCLSSCASGGSGGGGGGGGGSGGGGAPDLSRKLAGNVQVTFRSYYPNRPSTTMALVNATSEVGRKLQSGKATSTVIRVVADEDMARLLAEMESKGFSAHAKEGASLANLAESGNRRGFISVEEGGRTRGLDFQTGTGSSSLATSYTECKKLIWGVHMAVPGYEVRATTDSSDDADRVFQAPPLKLPRR